MNQPFSGETQSDKFRLNYDNLIVHKLLINTLRARLHETRSEFEPFEISNLFEKSFRLHGDFTAATCK